MILIAYAYKPEVKELKRLVSAQDGPAIAWLNWKTDKPIPEFLKADTYLILNLGFAGSLTDDLKPGQIVLANSLIRDNCEEHYLLENDHFHKASSFAVRNNISEVTLFTSSEPILSTKKRQAALRKFKAHAVDMEAGHLLQVANQNGIPFLSFKIISDKADSNAWPNIKNNIDIYSRRLGETVFEFLKQGSWI